MTVYVQEKAQARRRPVKSLDDRLRLILSTETAYNKQTNKQTGNPEEEGDF